MKSKINLLKNFWKNKKVFLTGHTGFKGSWLVLFLNFLGAKVYGYSLKPKRKSLYNLAKIDKIVSRSTLGDIRNYKDLKKSIKKTKPDFLIHMAAQPLVRYSYDHPKYTYEVNTLGTINILNIVNEINVIKNVLIITTDKVYKNNETKKHFKESDILGGSDPYSNSKACAELINYAYYKSYFEKKKISCVTARAGNVIGGGDFSENRIIPDYFRSFKKKKLFLRYPNAIRPWQHVLEPLYGYILLLMNMKNKNQVLGDAWNFGPKKSNNQKVTKVVSILNNYFDNKIKIIIKKNKNNLKKESRSLMLDSSKSRKILKWNSIYNLDQSIKLVANWHKSNMLKNINIKNKMLEQIKEYINIQCNEQ